MEYLVLYVIWTPPNGLSSIACNEQHWHYLTAIIKKIQSSAKSKLSFKNTEKPKGISLRENQNAKQSKSALFSSCEDNTNQVTSID